MSVDGPPRHRADSYQRSSSSAITCSGSIISEVLLARLSAGDEGELAQRLADLVRKETCADVARRSGWRTSSSARRRGGGRAPAPSVLGDICEAVIGAIYLDGG